VNEFTRRESATLLLLRSALRESEREYRRQEAGRYSLKLGTVEVIEVGRRGRNA
jgi:hypothetical protein